MHAVFRSGGKQYRVAEGDVVSVERLSGETGDGIAFEEVLMLSDGGSVIVGRPLVEKAVVRGTVAEQIRDSKVLVFRKKRRKNHRRRRGHRQHLTVVRITGIEAPSTANPPVDAAPVPQAEG